MSIHTDQYVTVMIEAAALRVYGPDYANGWLVKTRGDIHRCPVDEAYTLVASGQASYPDGVEKLKELMYQAPIADRMQELEANLSSSNFQILFALTKGADRIQQGTKKLMTVLKTVWEIKGIIVIIAGLLGSLYLLAQSHGLPWALPNQPAPRAIQTPVQVRPH